MFLTDKTVQNEQVVEHDISFTLWLLVCAQWLCLFVVGCKLWVFIRNPQQPSRGYNLQWLHLNTLTLTPWQFSFLSSCSPVLHNCFLFHCFFTEQVGTSVSAVGQIGFYLEVWHLSGKLVDSVQTFFSSYSQKRKSCHWGTNLLKVYLCRPTIPLNSAYYFLKGTY